jgi:hypothetical protein
MTDEWVDGEWMDMYQMHDAMQAAGIKKFNTLMFHNCYMGNMETLTQAYNFADYIFASAHALSSNGELMTEFVRGLVETGDPVKAGGLMFERCTPVWQNSSSLSSMLPSSCATIFWHSIPHRRKPSTVPPKVSIASILSMSLKTNSSTPSST